MLQVVDLVSEDSDLGVQVDFNAAASRFHAIEQVGRHLRRLGELVIHVGVQKRHFGWS